MNKWSVKIKSVHNEILIFDLSKMLKIMNIHFKVRKSRYATSPHIWKLQGAFFK